MSLRRWTDALGPPLLAAAALAMLVVPAVAAPARSRAIGGPSIRSAGPPLALPACRTSRQPASPQKAEVRGAAWYRLDPVLSAAGGLEAQRLVVGRVGGRADFELPLPVESFASGPSRGRILVGDDDGRRSTVRVLHLDGPCAVVVHEGRDLIRRAVFDASTGGIVEFRLDRASRADLGVWSRPFDGRKPVLLLDPLTRNDRIGRVFATALSWSTDGTRLVVTSCGESFCLARIRDQFSGRVITVDDRRVGDVIGLVGDDLVAYGGCPALPCEIVVFNVRTGRVRVLAPLSGLAAISAVNGDAVVVFEDYRADRRLRVVGADGTPLRTLPLDNGLRLVPSSDRALAAIELPPGVVALAEGGRPGIGPVATFVNLADGRRLPAAEVLR